MDPITIALALASQFAPALIKHFTNSDTAGDVAGKVIDLAKTITGKGTPDEATAALQADPNLALQFKMAAMANETELAKTAMLDVQDARARDDLMIKAGIRNKRADYMVLLDVVGLITCLVVLCFFRSTIPPEAVGLISTIAATFGLCLRDAHTFEFGSSRSSQSKDATIAGLAQK